MYILKLGLIIVTGAGFGLGVDRLSETNMFTKNSDGYYRNIEEDANYGHMGEDGCISGNFLEHMLENLAPEELLVVQNKIDELLVEYSTTIEELNKDYDLRYNFMNDLMNFFDANEIDYDYHEGYHYYDNEEEWHRGMGMH